MIFHFKTTHFYGFAGLIYFSVHSKTDKLITTTNPLITIIYTFRSNEQLN